MLFQENRPFTFEEAKRFIPQIKLQLDAAEAAAVAERKQIVGQLRTLEAEFSKNYISLKDTADKAEADRKKAEAEFQRRTNDLLAANRALRDATGRFSMRKDELQKKLIEDADPRIDEAIRHFQNLLQKSRTTDEHRVIKNPADLLHNGTYRKISTNTPAVKAKFKYLQNAIEQIRDMKLEAEFDPAAVEALEAGIPSIDVYSEET